MVYNSKIVYLEHDHIISISTFAKTEIGIFFLWERKENKWHTYVLRIYTGSNLSNPPWRRTTDREKSRNQRVTAHCTNDDGSRPANNSITSQLLRWLRVDRFG
jgi:hypothetical protein